MMILENKWIKQVRLEKSLLKKVIANWDKKQLLQNYYKMWQKFITKCVTSLLQSASGITKCGSFLLQSASGVIRCDSYYKVILN